MLGGLACVWIAAPVRRGGFVRAPALAAPAVFGVVVAVTLLAGVFEATPEHDAEWAAALVLGAIIGRARGWSLRVEISLPGGLVRLRSRWDEVCFAGGVAATAVVDFLNAALGTPVIHPVHVAAVAAFCAGFLGCWALAVLARLATGIERRPSARVGPIYTNIVDIWPDLCILKGREKHRFLPLDCRR